MGTVYVDVVAPGIEVPLRSHWNVAAPLLLPLRVTLVLYPAQSYADVPLPCTLAVTVGEGLTTTVSGVLGSELQPDSVLTA